MTLLLLALAALLAYAGAYTAALVVAVPLALVAGARHTARKSGLSMIRTGARRVRTGRL